jgi:hypothetical protein
MIVFDENVVMWCVLCFGVFYKDVVEFVGRCLEMEKRMMIFGFASSRKLSDRTCVF